MKDEEINVSGRIKALARSLSKNFGHPMRKAILPKGKKSHIDGLSIWMLRRGALHEEEASEGELFPRRPTITADCGDFLLFDV